jgi:hypothetical protein
VRGETGWKIAEGFLTVRFWCKEAVDRVLFAPLAVFEVPIRNSFRFSKQFREGHSRNFALRGFCELGQESRNLARKEDAPDSLCLSYWGAIMALDGGYIRGSRNTPPGSERSAPSGSTSREYTMLASRGLCRFATVLIALCAAFVCLALARDAGAAGSKDFEGFRGRCYFDRTAVADPIARTEHRHEFFGARGVTNDTTYADLRVSDTTCNRGDDRSAYWMPKIRWGGEELTPTMSGFYFQSKGGLNPRKTRPFPEGFKMVAGEGLGRHGEVGWICDADRNKPVHESPPVCDPAEGMGLKITFPECWDGQGPGADGGHSVVEAIKRKDGSRSCPSHHPVQLPTLTMWPDYPTLPSGSGEVGVSMGHEEWGGAGSLHADAFVGFDTGPLVEECIVRPATGGERSWNCNADRFDD